MADKEVQKVKIQGALWNFRNFLGIIKDILIIILLLMIIGGIITYAPKLMNTLTSLSSVMGTLQSGGPEALLQEFKDAVNSGDWPAAEEKLNALESTAGLMNLPEEAKILISQLKEAVKNKDAALVNQLLSQMDSSSSSQNMPDYRKVN